MSSHREAPEISKDPVADSTDVYAFVSPDRAGHRHADRQLHPAAGPGRRTRTSTSSVTTSSTRSTSTTTATRSPTSRTSSGSRPGSATSRRSCTTPARSTAWTTPTGTVVRPTRSRSCWQDSRRRFSHHGSRARRATSAPGPLRITSTSPTRPSGRRRPVEKVFAGQRAEGFYVDLGSIFDLGALRPFQNLHLLPLPPAPGVNATAQLNVHTIALQVPITDLTKNGRRPTDPADPKATIGVYTSASRQKVLVREIDDDTGHRPVRPGVSPGEPAVQRGHRADGPQGRMERTRRPSRRANFVGFVSAARARRRCCRCCIRASFPNLAALNADRADLVAILLTGHPGRTDPGLPELHRDQAGRPASAQRRDPAVELPERLRVCWAATWPASRTAGGSSTTWSPSSCAPSQVRPTHW